MCSSDVVLLVEDDSAEVSLIKDGLSHNRILNQLHVVSTGEEALCYLQAQPPFQNRAQFPLPCLILLDLKIPGMGGLEVLRWVRQHPGLKKTPVVILTHSDDEKDMAEAYDLGANSYLVKPFDLDAFRELIKSINAYWLLLAEKPSHF
jgi:CheY-like chemotaxis protein